MPSPPSSRKNSIAGLPVNVPSGPAATRTNSTSSYRDANSVAAENRRPRALVIPTDLQVASPGSISGASTPAQVAPTAPSMLPVSRKDSASGPSPQQEAAPLTMASLRSIKLRKKAIAINAKINGNVLNSSSTPTHSISALQDQLAAQQSEITQLRSERDDMVSRIKNLENDANLSKSPLGEMARSSELVDQSSFKDAFAALVALDVPLKLSELKYEQEKLKAAHDETTSGPHAHVTHFPNVEAIEKRISNLEKGVESPNNGQKAQRSLVTKDQVKELIKEEMNKVITINQSLITLSEDQGKQMEDIVRRQEDFVRRQQDGKTRLEDLERREGNTYEKASNIQKEFEKHQEETSHDIDDLFNRISKYIGPIQKEYDNKGETILARLDKLSTITNHVKSLQEEQSRLSAGSRQSHLRMDELSRRLEAMEKDPDRSPKPGFKKVGTPAQSSIDKAFMETTKDQLSQLDERIKNTEVTSQKQEVLAKDIKSLENRLSESEQNQISMHKAIEVNVAECETRNSKRCEELATDVAGLSSQVSELQLNSSLSAPPETQSTASPSSSMDARLQQVEANISTMRQDIEQVDNAVQEVEQKTHGHANLIEGLEDTVPTLFREKFDGLKSTLEEQLATIARTMSTEIQERKDHATAQDQANQDVRTQLAQKADIALVKNQLDRINAIIKNLSDRYDNITTDSIHQQMAHWFMQTYPAPAASMMNQISTIQHEFVSLRTDFAKILPLTTQLSWIQTRYPDLVRLLNSSPQLQALLDGTADMQQLPQTLVKVEEACNTARAAMTKSEEAQWKANQSATETADLKTSVDALNTLVYSVNTNLSSCAKGDDLKSLQDDVRGWQAHYNANWSQLHDARIIHARDIKASAAREHDERVKREEQLRKSIDDIRKMAENLQPLFASTEELRKSVSTLHDSSTQVRKDFDNVNDQYIQPHKDFLGMVSVVIIVVKDLQRWVESINQNLDQALTLEWQIDMNAPATEPTAGT